jgi:glutamate racemase
MKNKKYHTVGTISIQNTILSEQYQNSIEQIAERGKIDDFKIEKRA